jgi:hypothetical protein
MDEFTKSDISALEQEGKRSVLESFGLYHENRASALGTRCYIS